MKMVGSLDIEPIYTIDELREICWYYGQLYENLSTTQVAIFVDQYKHETKGKIK
jgi:hypothetical protein